MGQWLPERVLGGLHSQPRDRVSEDQLVALSSANSDRKAVSVHSQAPCVKDVEVADDIVVSNLARVLVALRPCPQGGFDGTRVGGRGARSSWSSAASAVDAANPLPALWRAYVRASPSGRGVAVALHEIEDLK